MRLQQIFKSVQVGPAQKGKEEERRGKERGKESTLKKIFTRGGEKSELKVDAQLLLTPPAEIKKQMS